MMEMISRCGFKCHACMAFKDNNKTAADQAVVAHGWAEYFGVVVLPEKIRCNGCLAKDRGGYDFPDTDCPIAPCVTAKGLDNCAGCPDYACEKLETRMRACDEVRERFLGKVSREEFERFIMPYDSRTTLNGIRKTKGLFQFE
jgi:hypothetical protein